MAISRRDLLVTTAGLVAGAAGAKILGPGPAFAQADLKFEPEEGASLRLLRWSKFVQGDEDLWNANTKKFTESTGVEVRIDNEAWEDVRPKAAFAANFSSGPYLILCWFDDPPHYPDQLLPLPYLSYYLSPPFSSSSFLLLFFFFTFF